MYYVNSQARNVITTARFQLLQRDPTARAVVCAEPKLFLFDCGDISPSSTPNCDYPVFEGCKELFALHNDKNFNYYWIGKSTFPNLAKIHFSGSMAEYPAYQRYPKEVWAIESMAQYFPKDYPRTPYDEFIAKLVKEGFLIPKADVPVDAPMAKGRMFMA